MQKEEILGESRHFRTDQCDIRHVPGQCATWA